MIPLLFTLAKKKKKKYNGSNMTDRLKPPVRLNLGGKTLGAIVEGLEGLGWTTNTEALRGGGVDLGTMMFQGNTERAEFWHRPPVVVNGKKSVIHNAHRDTLIYVVDSLVRECPTGSTEVVSSAVVES